MSPSVRAALAFVISFTVAACGGERPEPEDGATLELAPWSRLAESRGAQPGRGVVVIGVRGRDAEGARHATRATRAYDDVVVVLARGVATPFRASTHPWEQRSASVPDVDRDGRRDIGMIRPGVYRAVLREASRNIGGAPTFHLLPASGAGERIPAWRNTNQDEEYSSAERAASEARGDYQTAILFHQGEDAPPAVGCQVLPADQMRAFAALVGPEFQYVLVDDADDVPLL
ncbi:MAG: hypothetical protein IPG50_08345 [Myxococcales bacterium]|nr:hypothetical protein [Myxococcales bacterium]